MASRSRGGLKGSASAPQLQRQKLACEAPAKTGPLRKDGHKHQQSQSLPTVSESPVSDWSPLRESASAGALRGTRVNLQQRSTVEIFYGLQPAVYGICSQIRCNVPRGLLQNSVIKYLPNVGEHFVGPAPPGLHRSRKNCYLVVLDEGAMRQRLLQPELVVKHKMLSTPFACRLIDQRGRLKSALPIKMPALKISQSQVVEVHPEPRFWNGRMASLLVCTVVMDSVLGKDEWILAGTERLVVSRPLPDEEVQLAATAELAMEVATWHEHLAVAPWSINTGAQYWAEVLAHVARKTWGRWKQEMAGCTVEADRVLNEQELLWVRYREQGWFQSGPLLMPPPRESEDPVPADIRKVICKFLEEEMQRRLQELHEKHESDASYQQELDSFQELFETLLLELRGEPPRGKKAATKQVAISGAAATPAQGATSTAPASAEALKVEEFPDGSKAPVSMFSARFDGGEIEQKFRRVHGILKDHKFDNLMVATNGGDEFGDFMMDHLARLDNEKGVMIAVCTENYGEMTASPYSSNAELKYALDRKLRVLPLRVVDSYPPQPPHGPDHAYDKTGEAGTLFNIVVPSSTVFLDCRDKADTEIARLKTDMEIARMIAEELVKFKSGAPAA